MQKKYLYAIIGIVIIIIAAVAAYAYLQSQTPKAAVTLDFWAPFSGEDAVIAFWNNVSDAYKTATGNTVRVSMYSGDEFFTKITTALGSGSPPDLFTCYGGGELDTYINESAVADISSLFSESWAQSQIGGGAKDAVTRNGIQYAIPYELQTDWLYINKALFTKYNITVPSIDTGWTWDQFINASNTLKAAGITPVAMSGADTWAMTFPETYMYERVNGPNSFASALARNTSFTPGYTDAFNAIKNWTDGNYFEEGWQTLHYTDAAQLFQSGSAAMWIQGTWGVGMISDNASTPMQLGVAQWPYFPAHSEANKVIFGEFTNVAVAAAGKHKSEAEDFLRFISKPEWIVKYAQQTYNPVAQTVTLPSGTYPPVMADIQAAIAEAPMLHIRFGSMAPKDLGAALDEQNLLVWTGQKSPSDAAAAIEAKAVEVLGPVH